MSNTTSSTNSNTAADAASTTTAPISISVSQQRDYQFLVDFGNTMPNLLGDEPPPLGAGIGPTPTDLLLAGVVNCLTSSLLFAMRKFRQEASGIKATASAQVERNEDNRLRITGISVAIQLGSPGADIENLERILSQFEAFCTVSQSVQQGIPLSVTVDDADGVRVKNAV